MPSYIGQMVDGFTIVPDRSAQLAFGEHSFDDHGRTDSCSIWIYEPPAVHG